MMFGGVIVNCCFCFVAVFFGLVLVGYKCCSVYLRMSAFYKEIHVREKEREMFSCLTRMHVLAWAAK